jgi:hypothetical protein
MKRTTKRFNWNIIQRRGTWGSVHPKHPDHPRHHPLSAAGICRGKCGTEIGAADHRPGQFQFSNRLGTGKTMRPMDGKGERWRIWLIFFRTV